MAMAIAIEKLEPPPSDRLFAMPCREISVTVDAPVYRDKAAKLELWSLFQGQTSPQCTVRPRGAGDVASVLAIAREQACHFAVLGGGTSPFKGASNAEGGITIDMSLLKNIELDPDSMEIAVGGGSLWADVYRFLDPRNLSATGTRNSLTGVVGSVLGGGISFFSQNHGWACDNVKQFEVVLANSSVVHASETKNPDLFWALRGGGNNFGVVTSLTLEHVPTNQFVITERLLASEKPALPRTLPVPSSTQLKQIAESHVLAERVYKDATLAMSEKMDRMNAAGFFNYFGSVTVKNNVKVFMAIADTFREEASSIKDALGLQIYIVYNPLTVSTIQKMSRRGGNALGIRPSDGPLTIVNINLHWSNDGDTEQMRSFMRRLRHRIRHVAASMDMLHPYLFQNHAFEEDDIFAGYGEENRNRLIRIRGAVDPDRVFARLQPGCYKLG
ncbi:MAG: hypothetical protein ASARMPRED_007618 [Alectoria sarmentosa]|nr:MAG: hypothetical protein ASARMPRED_007618 [Alectoria sarmentosa]